MANRVAEKLRPSANGRGKAGHGPDMAPCPNGGSIPKVEKFGWTVIDKRGKFRWVPKGELNVDSDYQRQNVNNGRVLELAQSWSWIACGTLNVARRADGSLWVMDGQHRKLAADKRSDIAELPCLVFDVDARTDEARGFLNLNTHRGPVKSLDRFNAMVMAGDAIAIAAKQMIEASGYKVARNQNRTDDTFTVRCIATVMRAIQRNPDAARVVWELCVELYGGEQVPDLVFDALFALESFLARNHAGTLRDPATRAALLRYTTASIVKSINESRAFLGSGARSGAEGIVRLINKGRRTRKLPHPFAEVGNDGE